MKHETIVLPTKHTTRFSPVYGQREPDLRYKNTGKCEQSVHRQVFLRIISEQGRTGHSPRATRLAEQTWKQVPASSAHRWGKLGRLSGRGVGTAPALFPCADASASWYTGLHVLAVILPRERWGKTFAMVLVCGQKGQAACLWAANSFDNVTGLRPAWAHPDTVFHGYQRIWIQAGEMAPWLVRPTRSPFKTQPHNTYHLQEIFKQLCFI